MKKNNTLTIVSIVLLSIVSIGLVGLMIGLMTGRTNFGHFKLNLSSRESTELIYEETYDNQYQTINVESGYANIHFKKSDNDQIKVVVYSDEEEPKVNASSDELSVELKDDKCTFFCINKHISRIEVYVPALYENEIIINDNYGDIEVDDFINATMKINNDCGDIKVSGANILEVNNDYGDINIGNAIEVNAVASCGNIDIDTVDIAKIADEYGDITIDTVNKYMSITDECGDIEINNAYITEESNIKNDFGNIKINNTSEIYFNATTDLGDVKINNNYNKSDVTLKLENDCGDITIDN